MSGGREFNFLREPDERLKCGICSNLAVEVKQHDGCGQLFCKDCLGKAQEKECTSCKAPNPSYFNDARSQREINSLEVKCGATECTWKGVLSSLEKHMSECDFTLISCTNNCMAESRGNLQSTEQPHQVRRQDLQYHLHFECPKRPYQCNDCGETGQHAYITGEHRNNCPMAIVNCPSEGCLAEYQRKNKEEHQETCPYLVVDCDYDNLGCSVKKMRKEMPKHINYDGKYHMECALNRIHELKNTIFNLRDTLSSLEERHVPILTESSNVTFRVTRFEARKVNSEEYKSKQFYLHDKYGHKLSIVFYPNGILGQFEGHLCVTAVSSQFPAVKRDNFQLKVELLNQCKNDHTRHDFLLPSKSHTSWNTVKLISHKALYENSEYLRHDGLYLRVTLSSRPIWTGCALELEDVPISNDD